MKNKLTKFSLLMLASSSILMGGCSKSSSDQPSGNAGNAAAANAANAINAQIGLQNMGLGGL